MKIISLLNEKFSKFKSLDYKTILGMFKKRKVFIPSLIILIFVIILIFLQASYSFFSIMFSGTQMISAADVKIGLMQKKIEHKKEQLKEFLYSEADIISRKNQFWVTDRDGNINAKLQSIISAAAQNLTVTSMSPLTISQIGDGISSGQFQILTTGNFKDTIYFLSAMKSATPKMFWNTLQITSSLYNNQSALTVSASVQFIIIENDKIVNLITQVQ